MSALDQLYFGRPLLGRVDLILIPDCPNAGKYIPEINRLSKAFGKQFEFRIVTCDPAFGPKQRAAWKQEFGILPPITSVDDAQLPVRNEPWISPTAVVWQNDKVAYVGRIDDRFPKLGVQVAPKDRTLQDVLARISAGEKPKQSYAPAVGCIIPKQFLPKTRAKDRK